MKSFLEEVVEDLTIKLGGGLAHSALVFVNKRPLVFMQNYLAAHQEKPVWSPDLFTIQEFFGLSSHLKIADNLSQFFSLWEAFQDCLEPGEWESLTMDRFYHIGQTILADFSGLDEDLIPVQKIYQDLRDLAIIDRDFGNLDEEQLAFLKGFWSGFSPNKMQGHQEQFIRMWNKMERVYTRFHQILIEKGLSTQGKLYRNLAEGKEDIPQFLNPYQKGKLVFIGFNALSKSESILFQKWQKEGRALFYFDVDEYYIEDEFQEAGRFLRRNLEKFNLENALGKPNAFLRQKEKKISLYAIQGRVAQAKFLPQLMKNLSNTPQDSISKTALVLADENLLIPVLQSLPRDKKGKEILLNITMGYSLLNSPLFGFIQIWLDFQEKIGIQKRDTFLMKDLEKVLDHALSPLDRDQKREFREWILSIGQKEITRADFQIAFPIMEILGKDSSKSFYPIVDLIEWIEIGIDFSAGNLMGLDWELATATIKELVKLNDQLTFENQRIPFSLTLLLLKKVLKSLSVPLKGEPLQGLQIMGLMETRALDFEDLYILGASETFLPKPLKGESFIPHSIRKAYGLTVQEDQEALVAYVFYRLFHRSQDISILYNSIQDENNSGEPSRFLRQIEYESGLKIQHFNYAPNFQTMELKSIRVEKTGKVWEELEKYFRSSEKNPSILSASRFTTYLSCSLQFYFRYIAGIKEEETLTESLDAQQLGKVLHLVLFEVYKESTGDGIEIDKDFLEKKMKALESLCVQSFLTINYPNQNDSSILNGKDKIALAIIQEYAEKILHHDMKLVPFKVLFLEYTENFFTPFSIKIQNKDQKIILKGILDRLDFREGMYRLVDYKTGKEASKYSSLEDNFDPDRAKVNKALIQALFYSYIARIALKIPIAEPNLYTVRSLIPDTRFKKSNAKQELEQYPDLKANGKNTIALAGAFLENELVNFEKNLKKSLENLFNPNIPFTQTPNTKTCEFCPFKSPCGR